MDILHKKRRYWGPTQVEGVRRAENPFVVSLFVCFGSGEYSVGTIPFKFCFGVWSRHSCQQRSWQQGFGLYCLFFMVSPVRTLTTGFPRKKVLTRKICSTTKNDDT
ncbi:hypothetical protein SAY86_012069 [Trapa natans]|uniref:Uncharacterized protein n=1 Tax=Trapa natans TaxID=22666 RepID=A0AAN7RAB2_TRANT|nr:hypothetical protein SAY86_012069 [Trapa natans]